MTDTVNITVEPIEETVNVTVEPIEEVVNVSVTEVSEVVNVNIGVGGDATVTLMGDAFLTIPAGDTENILIQDASDSNIEPSSVTGNIIKYNINIKPSFSVAPVLSASGNQNVGTVITCGNGTVLGVPTITYTYQWKRNGVNFVNVGNSYTLLVGDVGTVITCSVTATNDFGSDSELTSNSVTVVASSLDPDAQAFITATGIVDNTIITAVNNLVLSLKAESFWTRMPAFYPLVGGTATTHKFNLKDPRDLDAAYRLTFSGSITHDANGMQGNGSNGFANTHMVLGSVTNINSAMMFMYSGTNTNGFYYDMGAFDGGAGNVIAAINARVSDVMLGAMNQDDQAAIPSTTDSTGFHAITRFNSTQELRNIRGTNTSPYGRTSIAEPTIVQYLMAWNTSGSAANYSPRLYKAFGYGDGFSGAELITLNTIVTTFQTELGR